MRHRDYMLKHILHLIILIATLATCSCKTTHDLSSSNEANNHELNGYKLPGFVSSLYFSEQIISYNYDPDVKIEINAPSAAEFDPALPTALVLYALPNGNSIDWTIGRQKTENDDWHYQIQHIGAQTRFIRAMQPGFNLVTVYLETKQQSWGDWIKSDNDRCTKIKEITMSLMDIFEGLNPYIILSGHSGGGNFVFGFIDSVDSIPAYVKRIVFLDSNYNWDDTRYGRKLVDWLDSSSENKLVVACYDDYNALLDGKHFVSKTGGTFYRSNMMLEYLKGNMQTEWSESEHENLIRCESANGSVQFLMRKNPEQRIWHTVLVEKNGFIHSILFGSPFENKGYKFMGDNAYNDFIQPAMPHPHIMRIPPRHKDALTGSEFIEKIKDMPLVERETAIYKEIANGNMPDSFRITTTIKTIEKDATGSNHTVEFSVLPDFLAIGSDDDFVRMPMLPSTAQRIANLFNATLPTRKMSDLIHLHSVVKLVPMPMTPDSTMTTVPIFYKHHKNIEKERLAEGQPLSVLTAGHKKDIVITNRLTEPGRVFIYGWHYPDGKPIQPLSGVHGAEYVDYSHGVRLINREIMIDGKIHDVNNVLQDANLYKLLSDEPDPMPITQYDTTLPSLAE